MKLKNCDKCGTSFESKTEWHKFCKPSCRVMSFESKKADSESTNKINGLVRSFSDISVELIVDGSVFDMTEISNIKYSGNDATLLMSFTEQFMFSSRIKQDRFELKITYPAVNEKEPNITHTLKTCGNIKVSYDHSRSNVLLATVTFRFSEIKVEHD